MKLGPGAKIGLVLGGYAVAVAAASAAVTVNQLRQPPDVRASGMAAAGDAMLFFAVFVTLGVLPTVAGLYFARGWPRFWAALSFGSFTLAATGTAAALVVWLDALQVLPSVQGCLDVSAQLAVLRLLPAPVLALPFAGAVLVAPAGRARMRMAAATGLEVLTAGYTVVHWFLPLMLGR